MSKFSNLRYVPAAVLALAVAQAASGQVITSTSIVPQYTINANAYTLSLALYNVNASGVAVGTEVDPAGGEILFVYNPATGTSNAVGFQTSDSSNYEYGSSTINSYNYIPSTGNLVGSTGNIIAATLRYYSSTGTSLVNLGQDAWIYVPGVNTTSTTPGILTPTLIGPQSTLTDSNGVVTSYFYTLGTGNATGHNYEYSTANSSNVSGWVVGTANRYSGLTSTISGSTTQLGTDAFLYQPGVGQIPLGLGVSNGSAGYSFSTTINSTAYVTRTSSLISSSISSGTPNNASLNNGGTVAGMTNRYNSGTSTQGGQDAWMYNASYGTQLIGLVGGSYESTLNSGTNGNTRSNTLTALNAANQVAGYTTVYSTNGTNGTTSTSLGSVAWVYSPVGTPTSSTGFTNGYVQVGLTDAATGTAVAHANATNPAGINKVVALANNGYAVGTATRMSTTSSSLGSDVWYYNGTTTNNISPYAIGSANIQTYQSPAPTTQGANTVPTVTSPTAGSPATSVYLSTTGSSQMLLNSFNSTGMVSGTVGRYNGATSIGQDAYVYDPATGIDYIIAAPAASASSYAYTTIYSLSDTGVAVGYYQTFSGATSSTLTGSYLFEWSETMGLVTLDQSFATPDGSGADYVYQGLNNALAGQTGWKSLLTTKLLADANGDIFGVGNLSPGSGTPSGSTANGLYEVTVPEPASLGLLVFGGLAMASRRRRSVR